MKTGKAQKNTKSKLYSKLTKEYKSLYQSMERIKNDNNLKLNIRDIKWAIWNITFLAGISL